jgi:hypothetical protein
MNLKDLAKYLRMSFNGTKKSLYSGDYTDMPREKIDKVTFKDGHKYSHKEYFFDKAKVYEYIQRKFN